MGLTEYERESTFKTSVTFTSGSTNVDPSGNIAYVDVYKSDGTLLWTAASKSGTRSASGQYYYYISTQSTDPLGVYVIDWYGNFDYGGQWSYMPKHEKYEVRVRYAD